MLPVKDGKRERKRDREQDGEIRRTGVCAKVSRIVNPSDEQEACFLLVARSWPQMLHYQSIMWKYICIVATPFTFSIHFASIALKENAY